MKSLPLSDVMSIVKCSNIKYMAQYRKFVVDNSLKAIGVPLYPEMTYKAEFPGVDAFLGNPEGTAVKAVSEVRSITVNKHKPWKLVENPGRAKGSKNKTVEIEQPVIVPAPSKTTSFASIIKTLHEEYGFPLTTLYRLNEEAKKTSSMKLEAINDTLDVLVKIAMEKTNTKVKV